MRNEILLLLVVAMVLFLLADMIVAAELCLLALVLLIVFGIGKGIVGTGKQVGKSVSGGVMEELENSKGKPPKGIETIGKMFEEAGAKTGEALFAGPRYRFKSKGLVARLGQGSKNLLDGLGKLFK